MIADVVVPFDGSGFAATAIRARTRAEATGATALLTALEPPTRWGQRAQEANPDLDQRAARTSLPAVGTRIVRDPAQLSLRSSFDASSCSSVTAHWWGEARPRPGGLAPTRAPE